MKKYLWLLVLATANVQATGVIAQGYIGNVTIALTDAPCIDPPNTGVAYAYYPNGRAEVGCWAADQSRVFVGLPKGNLLSFPLSFFDNKGVLK
mgnify:CR=1 FL=1|jgi:hypothetical protein